jgi:protein-tyrosine phosphatase
MSEKLSMRVSTRGMLQRLHSLAATNLNFLVSRWVKPNNFYRSARPDESCLSDREILRKIVGIKTILDLRTTTEHDQQTEKRKDRLRKAAEAGEILDDEANRPLQIPDLKYELVNFNGNAYSRYLISKLTWYQFFQLIYCMATGRRLEGISVLGENVMKPRGLSGLAVDSLDICTGEVKAVFNILADERNYPILVHCTQGKDRTGIVVQMLLMLLGTDTDVIDYDYMLSAPELVKEREAKLKEVHSIGLPDEFADCDPQLVSLVNKHIADKFGSIEKYLESCGVSTTTQQKVRSIMAGEDNTSTTKQ